MTEEYKSGHTGVTLKTVNRIASDPQVLLRAADLLADLSALLKDAAFDERSFSRVCRENGFDWKRVRALLRSPHLQECRLDGVVPLADIVEIGQDGYEKLYDAVFDNTRTDVQLPLDYVESMEAALQTLSERERKIIRMRYGLDGELEKSCAEVSEQLSVTRERIRQIELRAMKKMRHPSRTRILAKGITQYQLEEEAKQRELELTMEAINERLEAVKEEAVRKELEKREGFLARISEKDIPIESLNLTARPYNCLKRAGINTVGELLRVSDSELENIRNMGRTSYREVKAKLDSMYMED